MAGSTTGTSVLSLAFDQGVIMAADTLVSYGSMARFRNCSRIKVVNDKTIVGASGDYADFQFLSRVINQKNIDEVQWNDNLQLYPAALHSWITRVSYNKRSKFEPIWCNWIVGGLQPNDDGKLEPFLGFVDKLGTSFKSNIIATGFGQQLSTPLFRELYEQRETLPTEAQARDLIERCMKVLYYRDARSLPRYEVVVVKADGVHKEGPIEIKGDWRIAHSVTSY